MTEFSEQEEKTMNDENIAAEAALETETVEAPVEAEVVDGALHITVRLTVFFGYPFKKLAEQVRTVVAKAIDGQVGVPVSSVDVCIDSLVFPKE